MEKENLAGDLTQGSVVKQLIRFSTPFLLSNLIQALYNVVDMFIVGMYVGPAGISGVAIGGQVALLVTSLIIGLTVGATILVGQYFGARKLDGVKETIGTLFTILTVMAVVMTVLVLVLGKPILKALNTPEKAFSDALDYLNICALGTIFIFGYNAVSSILRGLGDSKRPLIFVSIACVLSGLLDFWFVGGLGMGAAGAAWATVIAQAVSLVLSIIYLSRQNFIFDFKLKSFIPKADKIKLILKLGIPSSAQNVATHLSFLFMSSISNSFGLFASSAVGIVGKFNSFAVLPIIAMSMSVSAMTAQNIGAKKFDRVKTTLNTGIAVAFVMGAVMFAAVQLVPQAIIEIFTTEPEVVAQGIVYLRSLSYDYLLLAFMFCMNGMINGAGHTTFSLVNSIISSVILRAPIAYLFGVTLGMELFGVGLAAPCATVGGIIMAFIYIRTGRWMKSKVAA